MGQGQLGCKDGRGLRVFLNSVGIRTRTERSAGSLADGSFVDEDV
jgi:hypothetical protein